MKPYLRHPALCGDRVLFVTDDDLWSLDTDTNRATRLTALRTAPSHPRPSPDGRWVAFLASEAVLVVVIWVNFSILSVSTKALLVVHLVLVVVPLVVHVVVVHSIRIVRAVFFSLPPFPFSIRVTTSCSY